MPKDDRGLRDPKLADLQLDHDVAAQPQVVEEHVEIEVLVGDLELNLGTNEGEARSQLQQEVTDVLDQPALELTLVCVFMQSQTIEVVGTC